MPLRTGPVAALLFCSGFCALVYQVGWLREFRLIFGASTAASAAVLAIFIGGLGTGGLLLGRRVDRHPRPLLFYSNLELVVAATAALSPLLLGLARTIYLASGGSTTLGTTLATIERLLLSTIVLAVPTVAMGGTLPAAARAVTRAADIRRQHLAVLYGVNTLGAVAGCLAATFFLLEIYGTRATLWLAAALNVLVAVVARVMDRREWEQRARHDDAATLDEIESEARVAPAFRTSDAAPAPSASLTFLLIASATVGFAFFLMELVWYRLLGPLLGGSVFTFGLVLAVALAGIGVGGLLYSLIGRGRPASLAGLAVCCLLEAAAVAATFALGDRIALLALTLLPLRAVGFAAAIGGWTLVTAIVVLVPAIIAGYQFPMLIALVGQGRERLGRDVGVIYAANTMGAIIGSLAGGFGLLPWLSAPGAWRLVAVVLVALGIAAAILDVRSNAGPAGAAPPATIPGTSVSRSANRVLRPLRASRPLLVGALAAATLLLLAAEGPTAIWRHSGIGAGRAPGSVFAAPNRLRAWHHAERRATIWEGDGVESSVALAAEQAGYAFIVNGKTDGSARGDAGTQVMLALLAAMRHPQPRRSLVIGLGTGSTAGWLGAIPSMEQVDVVELEPLVIDVARVCDAVNRDVLRNPKVHVTIGDARETLLTSRARYDVIASEPSNPFRAGIASLFTVEYYRAASARLTEDGVFAQWVQGYEIDAPTLRTIYATLASVFPQVETWQTNSGDLALIAWTRPRPYDVAALRARIAQEPYKSALANVWRATDIHGLLAHFIATDAVTRALAAMPRVEINTDDRNVVEFGLARSVGRPPANLLGELRDLGRSMGASRPPLDSEAGISWPAVDTAWAQDGGWANRVFTGSDPPAERLRWTALQHYYQAGDATAARKIWLGQSEAARNPWEMAMAADLEAEAGSETALPLIEQLRFYQPAEADTILATLRMRQSRFAEAASALAAAFARYRVDPWPLLRYKEKALALAIAIGRSDPATARGLYDALQLPFSLLAVDSSRLMAAADLSARFDFAGTCRAPIGALEPYVPWTAEFLFQRRDCYRDTNDPRLAAATSDLNDFFANESLPLAPPR
jgi:spermidine synthase/MFS family permease